MSRVTPKVIPVFVDPKTAKRFVRLLKLTRQHLNEHPSCDQDDSDDFICLAMDEAHERYEGIGKDYDTEKDQLQEIIKDRLDGCNYDDWFKGRNKFFCEIVDDRSDLDVIIQAGRAQWLEALIKEFKKKAKSE